MKEEEKPGRSEPIKTEKEREEKKFENECCKLARAVSLSGCGLCFPAFFFSVFVFVFVFSLSRLLSLTILLVSTCFVSSSTLTAD